MTRRATQTPQARRDLVEIAAHIAEHNEEAASRFLDAAALAFTMLAQFPGMGARREFRNPKLAGLRFWPITRFSKYLIFYLPTKRGIRVLRVIHGARDTGRIFGPHK